MIVPENEPIKKHRRPSDISKGTIQQVLEWPACYDSWGHVSAPISSVFTWDKSEQGFDYWASLSRKAYDERINFVLPEEARTYLRWLLKPEVKDNEEANR